MTFKVTVLIRYFIGYLYTSINKDPDTSPIANDHEDCKGVVVNEHLI